MGHEEMIDSLAATQHGVVARRQLLTTGLTSRMIDWRARTGRLVPVHAGVYLSRPHPLSFEAQVLAACLAAAPGAVASHRAAGFLHGLDGVRPAVEITVPRKQAPRLSRVVVHRTTFLPGDIEAPSGIPCTRPARTIIDLAAVLEPSDLQRALHDALDQGLITLDHLQRRLTVVGRQGRRGIRGLRALVDGLTQG